MNRGEIEVNGNWNQEEKTLILLPADRFTREIISLLKLDGKKYKIFNPHHHIRAEKLITLQWENAFKFFLFLFCQF